MIIIVPSPYEKTRTTKVEEFAEYALDGSSYDSGLVEAAAATSRNNSRAIGRLLDLLASKGFLNAPEVTQVLEGCMNQEATFTETWI